MKKVTLLLALATLLSMTMNAEVKTYVQQYKKADKVVVSSTPTAVKATKTVKYVSGTKADVPEGYAQVTLTAGDIWGDGSGYQMLLDEDAIAYGSIIPETGALTTSGNVDEATYAEFEYKIPENADGNLATSNIVLDASVTILIPAGVYDWCITNPTPGDRMWIASAEGPIPGRYDDFEFVSGAAYEFVIDVYGTHDGVELIVDDPTAPVMPTDVTVDAVSVDGTTATVAWVPGANNATWNLRWRPWVDPALLSHFWDFPADGYEAQLNEGFMIYDADEDGNNWELYWTDDAQTDLCLGSASYASGAALTPDNWLFTPEVAMGGTLRFDTWNYMSYYPDKIMVYVAPADYESIDEFVAISDFIEPGETPETIEIDLSAFEGMGVIAFRHYDCEDNYRIYIDNIEVTNPDAQEPAEWTFCENVENPYTIEGLMEGTVYEVQVQGVAEDARTTNWTESVLFTPEIGEVPVEPAYYIVGTFNGWSQVDGMLEFVDNKVEGVELEAEAEFKVITPAEEEGEWIWYGGEDANQVGYFLINSDLYGINITLCDGSNFRMEEAGTYNFELVQEGKAAPMLKVTKAEETGISTIASDKVDNRIFDLQGRELKSVPEHGIYIQNGKKYVK